MTKNLTKRAVFITAVMLLTGCATQQRKSMDEFDANYSQGNYMHSALIATNQLKVDQNEDYDSGGLLQHLEAAESFRLAGDLDNSIKHYDAVESAVKDWELRSLGEKVVVDGAASILSNDSVKRFQPQSREGILANTYKAISFLAKGDFNLARVELNRAQERMARAVQISSKQIEKEQKSENKKSEGQTGASQKIYEQFPELEVWEVYPDFVNPFTVYLHSLFLLTSYTDSSDYELGLSLLGRVVGMNPENVELSEQFNYFNQLFNTSVIDRQKQVWILHETGQSPVLHERKFEVPISVKGNAVILPFAFPSVKSRGADWPTLIVGDFESEKITSPIASMDRIVQTDFKRNFPKVVTKSVTGALVKGVAQVEATKKYGALGQLGGMLISSQTTKADLRIWRAMPSSWSVAKFDRPPNGVVSLKTPNGLLIDEVTVPDVQNTIIYIKTPNARVQPYIATIPLETNTYESVAGQ